MFSISPYFGIFGVLLQSISLARFLCYLGCPLFGLLIIIIYVGGMMVVFLFSTILCAEPYPELYFVEAVVFGFGVYFLVYPFVFFWFPREKLHRFLGLSRELGLSSLFTSYGGLTCFVAILLLVSLVVVLVLGFEHSRGRLRKL